MRYQVKLHKGQLPVYRDPRRIRMMVCGRRFGKSYLQINELILAALSFPGMTSKTSPETVLAAMPTLAQARKVLWRPLVNLCTQTELSEVVANINRTEYRIEFKGGKPSIQVAGANDNNGDRLRGMRFWFVGLDEYQDFKPGVFDEVVRAAMGDSPGSRALLTGTPKGRLNHFYTMTQRAKTFPQEYAYFTLPTACNPFIDPQEIETARKTLPPRLFRQEWLASWEDFAGKVYTELSEDNLVLSQVPNITRTFLGIDWGEVSPAIGVLGQCDNKWYFLEGWSPCDGQTVPQPVFNRELLRLANKYQPLGSYADPSRPSSILGIRELGREHGLIGLAKCVAGYNRIQEGIDQVHSLVYQRRLLFPDQTSGTRQQDGRVLGKDMYLLMESYRYKEKDGVVLPVIEDGQDDHCNDLLRYVLATSNRNKQA